MTHDCSISRTHNNVFQTVPDVVLISQRTKCVTSLTVELNFLFFVGVLPHLCLRRATQKQNVHLITGYRIYHQLITDRQKHH